MEPVVSTRRPQGAGVLGGGLIVLGGLVLLLQQLGNDVVALVGDSGWPLLVIVPGLCLLALSVVPTPPNGAGLAIGGSIVTAVGLVLAYQQATEHWESWAYAWALVGPTAAGVGMSTYGLLIRRPSFVLNGGHLALIGLGIFAVGAWFFESVFRTGRAPIDVEQLWPLILIGLGMLILLDALLGRRTRRAAQAGSSD